MKMCIKESTKTVSAKWYHECIFGGIDFTSLMLDPSGIIEYHLLLCIHIFSPPLLYIFVLFMHSQCHVNKYKCAYTHSHVQHEFIFIVVHLKTTINTSATFFFYFVFLYFFLSRMRGQKPWLIAVQIFVLQTILLCHLKCRKKEKKK